MYGTDINLDIRNTDLRKIVATTKSLAHKLFDLRKIFSKIVGKNRTFLIESPILDSFFSLFLILIISRQLRDENV